jgi:hypothetical protein
MSRTPLEAHEMLTIVRLLRNGDQPAGLMT